jgi:hypothetical protein
VGSLLHDEGEGTMSIMQDRVRTLDPSSQQEFVERGREAEAERAGPEPLEEARGLADLPCPRPGPGTRGRNGLVRVGVRTDGGLALKPCRSTT